jgi:hypothetical protein
MPGSLEANFLGQHSWLLYPILIWSLIWKGIALWRAARGSQQYWYIALLVFNTVGILEIIFLFFFAKQKLKFPMKFKLS